LRSDEVPRFKIRLFSFFFSSFSGVNHFYYYSPFFAFLRFMRLSRRKKSRARIAATYKRWARARAAGFEGRKAFPLVYSERGQTHFWRLLWLGCKRPRVSRHCLFVDR